MVGGGLTILICLFALAAAKPTGQQIDKRAKEEITFGNQQNGLKVKRNFIPASEVLSPLTEDRLGSIEAGDAHGLDGEESAYDDNEAKDFKDTSKAEEVVKLLQSSSPEETKEDNVDPDAQPDGMVSEPSEGAMSHGEDDVEGDDDISSLSDDVELETAGDDDDVTGVDTSEVDDETPSDSEDSPLNEAAGSVSEDNKIVGQPSGNDDIDPELLRRYYDNYLQKLYYKSNAYPYIMRYLYRRRRAALPRQLKTSKRNKRIKRDLYYPTLDDLALARRLLEENELYYGDDTLPENDVNVPRYNQLYDNDVPQVAPWGSEFEGPSDVDYVPYNYQYGAMPYQEEPSYIAENKRDFPPLGMLPGERRKKNTFFPVFEEPDTHWGEFVTRKRSQADNYERLLRLAEDLSDDSPYQYIGEYDYYRRKK